MYRSKKLFLGGHEIPNFLTCNNVAEILKALPQASASVNGQVK